jgi:hypothetical protein
MREGSPVDWTFERAVALEGRTPGDVVDEFLHQLPMFADRPDCVRVDRVHGSDGAEELRFWTRDPASIPPPKRTLP